MDFPRPNVNPSELIGDLKDRFGFGNSQGRYDAYEDDPYYDEYGEPAAGMGYDDSDYEQESYDPYDRLEYTTRSTGAHARSSRGNRFSRTASLVSSRDIRSTTSAYGVSDVSGTRSMPAVSAPAETEQETTSFDSYSTPASALTDFVSPYKRAASAQGSASTSSPGLDSLFTPSAPASSGTASSTNDPYAAYESGATFGTSSARQISVVRPTAYDDVSTVARSVRAGDIVVLDLKLTDAALSKRVLDFSFGVASALAAQVECVAEKTFVILQGKDLTLEERHNLAKQGITK